MSFKPSQYQEDIFEFVQYGYGNSVISAVAGSGKSTTMKMALNYVKENKKVLMLAFNNAIVEELKQKIDRKNTDIKTLHSLGFSILRYNFKEINIEVFEDKYLNKLFDMTDMADNPHIQNKKYVKNTIKLCNLGRFFLIKTINDLKSISIKYGMILVHDEVEVAYELIQWGKTSLNETNVIDYTDMVYLPSVLNVKTFKYDLIMIDEAQDLSESHMALFMKCFKQGSRFIAVGDENQSINGFAGSSVETFNKLRQLPNTIELPLSICYRCGKNIVKYAQKIVPQIEFSENAIEGEIKQNVDISELKDGDMVICRNTLPLVKLYVKLINNEVNCYLKGKDIGANLIDLIQDVEIENIKDLLIYLTDLSFIYLNKEDDNYNEELSELISEKIECIKIISIGLKTKTELIDKINKIFSEDEKGICLSTIHKSKGLEADNVYILNKYLTPSKVAKQGWEIEQEKNLEYVSYTRPKKVLGFIYQ